MRDKPILYSTSMVQALLTGKKTQTRRLIKPQPVHGASRLLHTIESTDSRRNGECRWAVMKDSVTIDDRYTSSPFRCPYGKPGDLLYVRETLECANGEAIGYPADGRWLPNDPWMWRRKTLPSIHMPKWLSRLTLEITNIRAERLQDISEEDAVQEGIYMCDSGYFWWDSNTQKSCYRTAKSAYQGLWELINGKDSWKDNPWVWVVKFKVHKCNVDRFKND